MADDRPIYLDYNATTPVEHEVAEAMRPYLEEHFGNPSSAHAYGRRAREAVETARGQVASLIGCSPGEIVFTGGGTESNNLAIRGAAGGRGGPSIVTTAIEHPAVSETVGALRDEGAEVTVVPVDTDGLVDPAAVERALGPGTSLVTVMHANNEVGTIQPIEEIGRVARARGVVFHTDAAQSAGKIPVDVGRLGVDLLTIAGHKLYAPKGVGALFVREGVALRRVLHGAGQEAGRRPGTESVPLIVGLGAACDIARRDLEGASAAMRAARDRLFDGLRAALDGIRLNGHPTRRLPNTLSVGFLNVEAGEVLAHLDGVAASAGAACHAGRTRVSAVLEAMRVPPGYAAGTIRFSTGRRTTAAEIDRAVAEIVAAVRRLRGVTGG
jgi:cysteine desulfurase